jgi:hypothetical protein
MPRLSPTDTQWALRGRFDRTGRSTSRCSPCFQQTVWAETSVGRALLKSVPAKVTRKNGQYRIVGAAWGAPIDRVDVRIDERPWQPATIDRSEQAKYAWSIWSLDWKDPLPGEHAITARAIDTTGQVQPAMDDPQIANKHTYWESNGQVTRRIRI